MTIVVTDSTTRRMTLGRINSNVTLLPKVDRLCCKKLEQKKNSGMVLVLAIILQCSRQGEGLERAARESEIVGGIETWPLLTW